MLSPEIQLWNHTYISEWYQDHNMCVTDLLLTASGNIAQLGPKSSSGVILYNHCTAVRYQQRQAQLEVSYQYFLQLANSRLPCWLSSLLFIAESDSVLPCAAGSALGLSSCTTVPPP